MAAMPSAAAATDGPEPGPGPGRALGPAEAEMFRRDGFHIARSMFTAEETTLVSAVCRADPRPRQGGGRGGKAGEQDRLSEFWMLPGGVEPDVYNAVCYSERLVRSMEQLMDDRVTLYHRKLVMKDAESFVDEGQHSGNAWQWHQASSPSSQTTANAPRVPTNALCAATSCAALTVAWVRMGGMDCTQD